VDPSAYEGFPVISPASRDAPNVWTGRANGDFDVHGRLDGRGALGYESVGRVFGSRRAYEAEARSSIDTQSATGFADLVG
jgi:hypothetical protein